ncbi:MAG: hypothetical protein QOG37_1006 [Mycobacterium sp.]|jgi:hypothetical protein|nr:hypothetical protein [Mycobacterium sp.]
MSDRVYGAGVVLLASGVAIWWWALFPSTVESGIYVPLPEASTPIVAEVNSAGEGVVGSPVNAARWINANLVQSKPTMYGLVTVRYPSPVVDVSLVPLRSKLQALLMLLHSQPGDLDPAALEAKLQALLKLPDSVLAQLMEHPDLAALNKMLDAVFVGTSDLSGVKTELDKIDVTSVPGTSEQIQVIKVDGKLAYTVHSPAANEGTENSAVSLVPAPPPPPGEPVTMASQFEAPAGLTVSDVTLAPSSEELTPPPAPAGLSASAFRLAPSSEELTPPPAPTPEIPKSLEEPTGTLQTSLDVFDSGNKFEPGETATQPSADNSPATNTPATNSPATQTAAPSTPATGGESPAEADGVTGDGGGTSP